MNKGFTREPITVPYKKPTKKLSNFELLKSLIDLMEEPDNVANNMSIFRKRPPQNPGNYYMSGIMRRLLNIQFGRTSKYFGTIGLPDNLRESLSDYLDEDLSDYYYLSTYKDFLDIDSLPIVNAVNEVEKLRQFYLSVLNQLFMHQEKKFIDDNYIVILDEEIIDNYSFFVNNKLYIEELGIKKDLFDLINQYFVSILHYKDHNFSLEKVFEYTTLKNNLKFDLNTRTLRINLNLHEDTLPLNGVKEPHYLYKIWFFLGKLIDFLTITELIGIYRNYIPEPNIDNAHSEFLELIRDRRVPVDEIQHKGALKKASSLGMTHLFLPLDEEAIPAGIPFSLKVVLEKHDKIANIWSIVPPVKGLYTIREYLGHNNKYPKFTTKAEPHLLSGELLKAQMSEDFYNVLINNYDWEHKDEAIKTLELIDEYPRLGNDLKKLAKERTEND